METPFCDCPEEADPIPNYWTHKKTVCKGCADVENCRVYAEHQWLYNHNRSLGNSVDKVREHSESSLWVTTIIFIKSIATTSMCALVAIVLFYLFNHL